VKKITVILICALFVSTAVAAGSQKKKIGLKRATEIALKRVHGTIKSKELEHEHGRWIYSFDIQSRKHKITEVNVDAYTGKIVGVDVENAAKESKEAGDEMKNKHR
jgi:uncharacterized membrane protein YkoI